MPRESFIPEAHANLVGWQTVAGLRILIVFDESDGLANYRNLESAVGVRILSLHMTILAGARSRIVADLILISAVEPFEIGQLFEVRLAGIETRVIHQRQIDRVAVAAHARLPDVGIVFPLYAQRVVHRVGDNFVVLERT